MDTTSTTVRVLLAAITASYVKVAAAVMTAPMVSASKTAFVSLPVPKTEMPL